MSSLPTIFVSLAAYRDALLSTTVINAQQRAKHPERIVFGIFDQSFHKETFYLEDMFFKEQIRYLRIDPEYSRGACWARSVAQSLMQDEDYFLQVDSHSLFDQDWDETLVSTITELEQYHPKPVISVYPHSFTEDKEQDNKFYKGRNEGTCVSLVNADETYFKDDHQYILARAVHRNEIPSPCHGFLISAGFLFGPRTMVQDVPYDPHMYFQGEEPSLALRLFTHGYNIFYVNNCPIYHLYDRKDKVRIWDDRFLEKHRPIKWHQLDKRARERFFKLTNNTPLGCYGLGTTRSLQDYTDFCHIDYTNKKLGPRATTGDNIIDIPYTACPLPERIQHETLCPNTTGNIRETLQPDEGRPPNTHAGNHPLVEHLPIPSPQTRSSRRRSPKTTHTTSQPTERNTT